MRAWLTALLALALTAGSFGAASAGMRAPGSRPVVDSLLGPLLICHQSDDAGRGAGPSGDDVCASCALCAALALSAAFPAHHETMRVEWPELVSPRHVVRLGLLAADWPPGGLGSRAPPSMA